jgi:hypothetical protein
MAELFGIHYERMGIKAHISTLFRLLYDKTKEELRYALLWVRCRT